MTRPELRLDSLYRNTSNWKDNVDIFNKMFHQFSDGKGIQNSGGFRYKSKAKSTDLSITNAAFVMLITTFGEIEWPDYLDEASGIFTYYGDKRSPGDLHNTRIGGNKLLRSVFENVHSGERVNVPPFLCFEACGKVMPLK